uniref:uncharacterized protein n=1 Tax=Myxine glutinosa TaxID=7769 RepID=UPI00358E2D77
MTYDSMGKVSPSEKKRPQDKLSMSHPEYPHLSLHGTSSLLHPEDTTSLASPLHHDDANGSAEAKAIGFTKEKMPHEKHDCRETSMQTDTNPVPTIDLSTFHCYNSYLLRSLHPSRNCSAPRPVTPNTISNDLTSQRRKMFEVTLKAQQGLVSRGQVADVPAIDSMMKSRSDMVTLALPQLLALRMTRLGNLNSNSPKKLNFRAHQFHPVAFIGSCILTPPSFTACVKRRHLPYENNICNVRPQRIVRRMFTNRRERWRQQLVATAFAALRRVVPAHPPGRRLSKQRVLRTALQYIAFLSALLQDLGGPEFLNETGAIKVMDLTQQVFIPIQDASGEETEDYAVGGNRNDEEFVTDGEETVLDETEGEETDAEEMQEETCKSRIRTDKCGKTFVESIEQGNKIVIHTQTQKKT